jgi:exosortase N
MLGRKDWSITNWNIFLGGILVLLLLTSWMKLKEYLNISLSLNMMWIVLLPFIIYVKDKGIFSYRFGFLSALMLVVYSIVQAPLFYFISFSLVVFFIIEISIGKLNSLAPLVILLVTPFTKFAFDIFGFPIRLFLSKVAAIILEMVGYNISSQGNLITLNGDSYSVDAECMGLRLVITSFLLTLMLISQFEKKVKQEFKFQVSLMLLIGSFVLVVVANLVRIISLIVFNSPPDTVSHELIGLGSIFLVVVVPMYHLIRRLPIKYYRIQTKVTESPTHPVFKYISILSVVTFISILGSKDSNYTDVQKDEKVENLCLTGYEREVLPNNIVKFVSDNSLLYIKPSKGFYRSDHNPFICWRGSGFQVKNEELIELFGTEVYFANLESETTTLYTAWWYDNGIYQTTNQIDWRWRTIIGEGPFRLINITTDNSAQLFNEVSRFLKTPPLPQ